MPKVCVSGVLLEPRRITQKNSSLPCRIKERFVAYPRFLSDGAF